MITERIDIGNYDITYKSVTWHVVRSDLGAFWFIAEGNLGVHHAANTLADAKDYIRYQMDKRFEA